MGPFLSRLLYRVARRVWAIIDAQEAAPFPFPDPVDLPEDQITWELVGGQRLVNVHPADRCAGQNCCIHNPSDHHMVGWVQNWRPDRGLMERICPHGVGHIDPDDPTTDRIHGCDGCCRGD